MLSDVCLSRTSGVTREQRGLGRLKLVQRFTPDSGTTFKVRGQGHQVTLVGCLSNYIIYMDDIIFDITAESEPLPVDHGARRAGRHRREACMGWSWAAACGVQGRAYCAASRTACYEKIRIRQIVVFRSRNPADVDKPRDAFRVSQGHQT